MQTTSFNLWEIIQHGWTPRKHNISVQYRQASLPGSRRNVLEAGVTNGPIPHEAGSPRPGPASDDYILSVNCWQVWGGLSGQRSPHHHRLKWDKFIFHVLVIVPAGASCIEYRAEESIEGRWRSRRRPIHQQRSIRTLDKPKTTRSDDGSRGQRQSCVS